MTNLFDTSMQGGDADRPRDASRRRTVAGLFDDLAAAGRAFDDLRAAGFPSEDVGVAVRHRNVQNERLGEQGLGAAPGTAPLGGVQDVLAVAIPGIGSVFAGGALATAFGLAGGTTVAGATGVIVS